MGAVEVREYSAGAVKQALWFQEFRKVVQLLDEGKTLDEVKALNKAENIFGCATPARATLIFNTTAWRIKALDKSFYPVFVNGDLSSQKLFSLVAAMAYDALLFDLVYEVIREKMIMGVNEFSEADVRIFFKNKQQQSEKAAAWTDYTLSKLSTSYKSMLYEAGLTDKGRESRKIFKPILEREMEDWLNDHGMSIMVDALTGVR